MNNEVGKIKELLINLETLQSHLHVLSVVVQLEDDFLLAEDEFGNEYIIESVKRKNILYDNGHYVLNLKSAGKGCIKF